MVDISKSPHRIAQMFDAIAWRYDLLNHLLSAGIDRRWRRRAIAALALGGTERVLDLCAGTADLAIAASRARPGAARVIGVDFAAAMLQVGRDKLRRAGLDRRIVLVRGDATQVPLRDESVDAVTVAFGIRNVVDSAAACGEMRRVLRPGGRLAILEFALPTTPVVGRLYLFYLRRIVPRIGRALSRHDAAYAYLPASIDEFAAPDEFVKTLRRTGFTDIATVRMTFGSVCLYTGVRG